MKRNLSYWQLGGFIFTAIGGVLLHFLYDWTKESLLIAPFSGVNESTWEHMKLLYFPILIFAIIESRFFKEKQDFWWVKLMGIIVGLLTIPILFYTYNGAFGKSPDWFNITIFFISAAVAFILETRLFKNNIPCKRPWLAFGAVCFIGLLFVVFTFIPPQIPLFQDPLTGGFGV
ncbi:MAG: hypothetical protein E7586_02630 [Ruminococcaceae bacterium]|nr:hypothetical protein [Oscillospiraceae bacterium]